MGQGVGTTGQINHIAGWKIPAVYSAGLLVENGDMFISKESFPEMMIDLRHSGCG